MTGEAIAGSLRTASREKEDADMGEDSNGNRDSTLWGVGVVNFLFLISILRNCLGIEVFLIHRADEADGV